LNIKLLEKFALKKGNKQVLFKLREVIYDKFLIPEAIFQAASFFLFHGGLKRKERSKERNNPNAFFLSFFQCISVVNIVL